MKNSSFNPKSRWDRHIPETDDLSQSGELNERIEVLAWFKNGRIHPRIFIWKNKTYKIKKINYNWQERHGKETISLFSISTGVDLYQISFSNTTYGWRLEKLIS